MKIYNEPGRDQWDTMITRTALESEHLDDVIRMIFEAVKTEGDKALIRFTEDYDKVSISDILLSEQEVGTAIALVDDGLKKAIDLAANNIRKFHEAQLGPSVKVETVEGVVCWQESRAISKVGIYIPGGSAPLFSTVLMLGIPAMVAGCSDITLCTPPGRGGDIHPAILYAASIAGVTRIARVGGVQAIAAMAVGTDSVPAAYKIFGPGNQYVTAAKQEALRYKVAIDLPAGPSELLVVADECAIPAFVAADLLSQAEHGADSQVVCVVSQMSILCEIEKEIQMQLLSLPRKDIIKAALEKSFFVVLADIRKVIDFVNKYAPEHLILCSVQNDFFIKNIENAGSVFVGNYSPESAGDYASGTNHTLPTNGFAKSYSGVNMDAFLKKITFQKINPTGMEKLGPSIELMATAEGLQAHKNAVTLRLNEIKNRL